MFGPAGGALSQPRTMFLRLDRSRSPPPCRRAPPGKARGIWLRSAAGEHVSARSTQDKRCDQGKTQLSTPGALARARGQALGQGSRVHVGRNDAQMRGGTPVAILPTSSSHCISFLIFACEQAMAQQPHGSEATSNNGGGQRTAGNAGLCLAVSMAEAIFS